MAVGFISNNYCMQNRIAKIISLTRSASNYNCFDSDEQQIDLPKKH